MHAFRSFGHVLGGTLLIAGTAIGVGMLALPVATGAAGFIPSISIYAICWLFMICTGLLLVEVSLWLPENTSFISMADKVLGPFGKAIFWIMYLFLFLTVMIAHVTGGGQILIDLFGWNLSYAVSAICYVAIFAPVVYLGAHSVDRLNILLISGVMLSYFAFVFVAAPHVSASLLAYANWGKAWIAFPILFTAFTFQVIIPTLMNYMERNVRKIRIAIILGSSIPLLIYALWEVIILGIIPAEGQNGLIQAAVKGQNAVGPLQNFVHHSWIVTISQYFAFFALTTSFIPLALSFFDFLADGLKWEKKGLRRIILVFIVFGIPTIIALLYPHLFLVALGYAGGLSCAFLFGLMPPLMAWLGRYVKKYPGEKQLFGGRPMLIFLMLFASLILVAEIVQQFI